MSKQKQYTPMMMQYLETKAKHPDEIVFYRLGDFYEMFFEDAKIASSELDLVLTGKNAGVEEKIPMCGIPFHSAQSYLTRLVQKGYKVAIVEQMENPATTKGIVKREVVKIVTPGTYMDDIANEKDSIYLASIHDYQYGLAIILCEMTTGELKGICIEKNKLEIQKVLLGNHVSEVVVEPNFDKKVIAMIESMQMITISKIEHRQANEQYKKLLNGQDDLRIVSAFQTLMNYLEDTQKRSISHLYPLEMISEDYFMRMDYHTRLNLELSQSSRKNGKYRTLWHFMDHCRSAMGSRKLKKWVENPLIDISEINQRLDAITYFNDNFLMKDELKEELGYIYDLERLCVRVAYGSANPRDVLRLIQTLAHAPKIFELLSSCSAYPSWKKVDCLTSLHSHLQGVLNEEAPIHIKDGHVFVEGYNTELDRLREISQNGKQWIAELECKERERTGIKSLKIGYNRVFGYYIEVTKTNLHLVKDEYGYVRKQTLTSAERFISEELKQREDEILNAQQRIIELENKLFVELLDEIRTYSVKLHELADALSVVDALYALSVVSSQNGYTRPSFHQNSSIEIIEGRHPILDAMMKDKRYVSNDFKLTSEQSILMITGPNMGGKSTYMRQSALIIVMAQIGCYVPAESAKLPIFDQIFTRIGASDDIMSGQSTFMVEMMEANHALQNATEKSLILFDEIGRGTSTYDGMSLAQAMLEYIAQHIHAKTLFSTHYHELTKLADFYPEIVNVHVEVHEEKGDITFLYRVVDGKADKSYGINVAKLAKLPNAVLKRAENILANMEVQTIEVSDEIPELIQEVPYQHQEIIEKLKMIDTDQMSPFEAMLMLYELKKLL
ncbi:MAG: DNA mismatch repair protein MutS [Longicatena sp.]|nr:DNA mismatch repair protein MutS [Longicatena sp.]